MNDDGSEGTNLLRRKTRLIYSGLLGVNVDRPVEQQIGACMVNLVADLVQTRRQRPDAVGLSALYTRLCEKAANALDGAEVDDETDAERVALDTVQAALTFDQAEREEIWDSIVGPPVTQSG